MPGYIEKTCQYHSEHHKSLAENNEDIKTLYHKINEAEKELVKVKTDLEKITTDLQKGQSKTFLYSVLASFVASILFTLFVMVLRK